MKQRHSDVWEAIAHSDPGRTALIADDGEIWSFGTFARDAEALAAALCDRGARPGERVALLLHNRVEFMIGLFACLLGGYTPVPINFRLRAAEVAAILDDSGAAVLLHPTSLTRVVAGAVELAVAAPSLVHIPDDDTADPLGEPWAALIRSQYTLPQRRPSGGELWIYTGGTTGPPKGVRWDVVDFFAAQRHSAYTLTGRPLPSDLEEATAIAVKTADVPVNLPLAPLMHGTALCTAMNTLLVGGTVLLTGRPSFDAHEALAMATRHRATRVVVAGDALALPLVDAAERAGIRLPSLRTVTSSGMRLSAETKRRMHALGDFEIVDIIASSEGGGFAATTTRSVSDVPGQPRLFPTAVVLDEDLEEIQDRPGGVGVLAQKGWLPRGYHADLARTAAAFPLIRGVRHVVPGDWVRVLPDRHIEFLGRRSGVINTGGEKVYPLEVEQSILSHPDVTDAYVLGVPDARFGEIVAAVVVSASRIDEADLTVHLSPRLAGFKKPRHVLFVASLDRGPTGKLDERRWREALVADRACEDERAPTPTQVATRPPGHSAAR